MTPDQAREYINARFITEWANETPIILDNESTEALNDDPFVILSIRHTIGGQESLGSRGNRKYNRRGLILLKINTLSDTGTKQADDLAYRAMEILEGERFNGIMTDNGVIRELLPDGKWYSVLVEIGFFYEETK